MRKKRGGRGVLHEWQPFISGQREDCRHRPRNDQLRRSNPGGGEARRDPQRGGADGFGEDVPFGGRLHSRGAAPRGRIGQEAGRYQPRRHDLRDKEEDGDRLQSQRIREGVHAATNQLLHPSEDQEGRGELPRLHDKEGSDNRSGPLQRQSEAGHQGRGGDSRAGGSEDNQRADGRLTGVRAGQAGEADEDSRLQLRGRNPRRHRDGFWTGGVSGPCDERRHSDRRSGRGLRDRRPPPQ